MRLHTRSSSTLFVVVRHAATSVSHPTPEGSVLSWQLPLHFPKDEDGDGAFESHAVYDHVNRTLCHDRADSKLDKTTVRVT